ncbi:MAG: phospho-N-acetylmuramoyl-pentapeptide-transferase [Bacteroidales bacterium]|jgi:phospho-N-acetylmuramoyl-pentapeptide-transferase|nr:phospho-N-acetylmuramoyl-pentapeptide-transferase [Bacteroidales bacterium]MCB9028588.1 phospho-N-acetylmuramoyl-pentapeptide-transferase [Bacteroidales bacterium]HOO67370.1 phospho-N-acetylmuramoyl-pentapeptide-transferase [Bacteroidales bacterium]HPE23305.1 phospho-N-acetylmuramoyl-pentapeptide-transferase [Bacteroidales bacterium]HPJ06050.1 phospho-N-acetylmuramoyl-pentapeptide-transferase [Bacteroidales bacterium]
MLYYLFRYLDTLGVPGAGVFNYLSFRSAAAVITSLIIAMLIGKRIIWYLQRKQIGETIRNLDLEGQYRKQGTPSMGGLIIIASILVPVLLFARLDNVYIILMIITTIWVGFIGFMDDYIKIFKKNKEGLAGRFKIIGQIGLGLIVALTLYISDDVVVRVNVTPPAGITVASADNVSIEMQDAAGAEQQPTAVNVKSTKTTIPFVKNNEFDYSWLVPFAKGKTKQLLGWLVFMAMVVFVVVAVSNGVNLTDGLDGLATGTSAVAGVTLGILAYVSGNIIYANYLNIMYLPNIGELVIFAAAFAGATVGFLWYNSYPAQVFMGDTGSLTLGGIIAVFAIVIRKELLIPILCGIFFVESLSVMLQVSWFKRTKRRFGEGRRIFLMAPLHHHYQKKGYAEPKIVTRFWIVAIILAVISVVTLKIR